MSALWVEVDDEEICTDCGSYPAKKECKVCKEPMCHGCWRRNKGRCSDCIHEDNDDLENE